MRYFSIILSSLFLSSFAHAQEDTAGHLNTVEVKGKKSQSAAASVTPVQILQRSDLENINGNNIADAARYFSGVQIKDYGGIGGLKTISVRSLGANHTGVSYDDIFLNDAQNGQIDLGKFSLNNVEQLALYNAQPRDILLPARAFSYASVLELKTTNPVFFEGEKMKLNASFNTGSFGLVNPSITLQNKLTSKLTSSLNADWQKANGEYNFTYLNGSVTEKGRRSNADINAFHAAYNLRYAINDSNVINADVYYYHSQRGLPGTIIINGTQGSQRQRDDNFFAQASWKKKISRKSELLIGGKYNYSNYDYLDTSYQNAQHRLEMIFRQREFYLSGAYAYQIKSFWKLAFASDLYMDNLFGNVQNFPKPIRYTYLNNISTSLQFDRLQISGNILNTSVNNKVNEGDKPGNYNHFSPTAEFIYQPAKIIPLKLRAFYKDIFRMPTFNDLYYTQVGNTNLKPETTRQLDAGITWEKYFESGFVQSIMFTADAYHNHIKDLILAVPRQNISQWSMQNVGKTSINGADINVDIQFRKTKNFEYALQLHYTHQKALNTDKTSIEYNNEIPYTPHNFASANWHIKYRSFLLVWNALYTDKRFAGADNDSYIVLPSWNTQDVVLAYSFIDNKKCNYSLNCGVNNLFNKQYQIAAYYPMPGRNYKIGIIVNI